MARKHWFVGTAAIILAAGFVISSAQRKHDDDVRPQSREPVRPIGPSDAVDVVHLTTKGYADRSEAVVLAKCVERKVDYGPGGNIFTFFTFAVDDTIKGTPKPSIKLRLFGGTIGDTTIPLGIDREFEVGSEYVLMVGKDNADGFSTLTPSAIFAVRTEPESGRKVVMPCATGIEMYEKASGRRLRAATDACYLDDFLFSLKKALR